MVRGRGFGILAGYEDQNDHDALRNDSHQAGVTGDLAATEPQHPTTVNTDPQIIVC